MINVLRSLCLGPGSKPKDSHAKGGWTYALPSFEVCALASIELNKTASPCSIMHHLHYLPSDLPWTMVEWRCMMFSPHIQPIQVYASPFPTNSCSLGNALLLPFDIRRPSLSFSLERLFFCQQYLALPMVYIFHPPFVFVLLQFLHSTTSSLLHPTIHQQHNHKI